MTSSTTACHQPFGLARRRTFGTGTWAFLLDSRA